MGAGGGSIASVDDGGMLTVGPESAGAQPGPVAYGLGGRRPTVTDANLMLGYLNPDYFLGGERRLEIEPARTAIDEHVASPMGLDGVRAAAGIVELVNSQMANGVRQVSIARGFDAREAALVVAGGAGPLHACGIAGELDLELVLVPKSCSVLCATGMLTTNLRHDLVRFAPLRLDGEAGADAAEALNALRAELITSGEKLLEEEHVAAERRRFEFTCDMQFEGQFNVLETPIEALDRGALGEQDIADIKRLFAEHHTRVYGYSIPDTPIEIQTVRLAAVGVRDDPPFRPIAAGGVSPEAARKDTRTAWFGGAEVATPIYEGGKLEAGNEITGPAIVEEPTTTLKVDPGWTLKVDEFGSYLLWRDGRTLDEVLARLSRRPG
jgi:N-methylhydantoinase A